MALFVRFFVVLFAFWLASVGAALTLVLGAAAPLLPAPEDWPLFTFAILTASTVIAALTFAPAAVIVLLAEAFRWRSVLIYAIAGAAIGLFSGQFYGYFETAADVVALRAPNAELLAGAGVAAGLVYWLVAGRTAGGWQTSANRAPEHRAPES